MFFLNKISSRLLFIMGLLLCIPLVWNYLQPHFFHLHDHTHVARLVELERGLDEGQMPVRWSQNLGYGYGMPHFSFYGPLFYAESMIFRTLGFDYVWAIKLSVILQVLVSFVALYKLGELLFGKWGGFLTAIAGTYAPYRLVDMYVRGAFAELSGMTFLALVLYAVVLWAKKPTWRNVLFVGLSGAGVALSHSLMALICAPFIGLWLGYWVFYEKRLKFFRQIIVIVLIAFGLSAFFTLPALFEKGYTQADSLVTGFSTYSQHFLYIRQFWQSNWGYGGSVWGIDDDVTFELGKVHIVALSFGLFFMLLQKKKNKRTAFFTLFLLLISLFLSILKSKTVWDALPLLAFVQFPWRFLSVSVVLVALLVGAITCIIPKKWNGIITLTLAFIIIFSQIGNARPDTFLENDQILYFTDAQAIQLYKSEVIPDFLPKSAQPAALPKGVLSAERFLFSPPAKTITEVHAGHEFLISIDGNESILFTARIFDFPGWTLYLNGQKIPHYTNSEGLIEASIPAISEERFLSGRFEETPLRKVANTITIISVWLVIGLWIL